ncbi:MAG: right-handed parallel beta-helix repeat-containing protein [Planctomycetota bacterium]|jgi:hypothetical protein
MNHWTLKSTSFGGGGRHAIDLDSCSDVNISGFVIRNSGGDGILVRSNKYSTQPYCENIQIRDVNCDGSYRCGIGVTDVNELTIEDCNLRNTKGHEPEAGIDFEPSNNRGKLTNIVVRNTIIKDNCDKGIDVYLSALVPDESVPSLPDVNILLENIDITGSERGFWIGCIYDNGPDGSVICRNVNVEDTNYGAYIFKSSLSVDLVFENCSWSNSSQSGECTIRTESSGDKLDYAGGIEFINCQVIDDQDLPAINFVDYVDNDLYEIHGDIYVDNPNRPDANLYEWNDANLTNVDVILHSEADANCQAHNVTDDTVYTTNHVCFTSINSAIDDNNTGSTDEIAVYPGTHCENIDYDGKAITIKSKDPNDSTVVAATIISGSGSGNVVTFDSNETSASVLEGFTIADGNRGIYCYYSSPTISKCVITDNNTGGTDDGAGMYNDHSDPNVLNCTFSSNESADNGGGMANYYSDPCVLDCTFSNNDADDDGGGMWNYYASPEVNECVFSNNIADSSGGGMYNEENEAIVEDCVFSGNSSGHDGGGMYNEDNEAIVEDCVFSGNSSGDDGGGMYNEDSDPNVLSCTFTDNEADDGGGMANYYSDAFVVGCTFTGNDADDDGGGMWN